MPKWQTVLKTIGLIIIGRILWNLAATKISVSKLKDIYSEIAPSDYFILVVVVLFMPINWSLEAKKWQFLLKNYNPISFKNAYKAVLFGATLGNISPFMIGDFMGRLGFLPKDKRLLASGSLIYGNGIQSLVLLCFAWLAYGYFFLNTSILTQPIHSWIWVLLNSLLLLGFLFYLKIIKFDKLLKKTNFLFFDLYNFNEFTYLFFISVLRHITFGFQYILLLLVFKVKLKIGLLFSIVNCVFLFKTIASFAGIGGDLLGRQLTSIYFFEMFEIPLENIITATLLLWIINVFFPMISGLIVALNFRFSIKDLYK